MAVDQCEKEKRDQKIRAKEADALLRLQNAQNALFCFPRQISTNERTQMSPFAEDAIVRKVNDKKRYKTLLCV